MNITEFFTSIAALGALLLTLTGFVKDQFGLDGRATVLVNLALGGAVGAVLAVGGIEGVNLLPGLPLWASGMVVGLLSALAGSGAKAVVTSVQRQGAQAQAKAFQEDAK